jgi:hypothetical protein
MHEPKIDTMELSRIIYIKSRFHEWHKRLSLDEEWALRDSGILSLNALIRHKEQKLRER